MDCLEHPVNAGWFSVTAVMACFLEEPGLVSSFDFAEEIYGCDAPG
jgi:hypothetical protein